MLKRIATFGLVVCLTMALAPMGASSAPAASEAVTARDAADAARSAKDPSRAAVKVNAETDHVVPGKWIVSLRAPIGDSSRSELKRAGVGLAWLSGDKARAVVSSSSPQPGIMRKLATLKCVEWVEPLTIMHAAVTASDPAYGDQWGLPAIGAPAAWETTTGAPAVTVAVIDTGVDHFHAEFAGRITDGYDFVNRDAKAQDDNGHGTHVAGIVGAAIDNGVDGTGVAPNVRIMPVKVLNSAGSGYNTWIDEGIRWAADHGADVINLSLAGGYSAVIANGVAYAQSKDVLVVAAAGNSGGAVSYPAALAGVVGVSAMDSTFRLAPFSNRGAAIDLTAPGVGIASSALGGGMVIMNGTSMAAPFVAGAAALVRCANPSMTQADVAARLSASATDIGAVGADTYFGAGVVNPARALAAGAFDQDVPGASLNTASVTDTLDASSDAHDVFAVTALAGQSLDMTLSADLPNEFELRLLGADADRVSDPVLASISEGMYPRHVSCVLPRAGTYYIDVHALSGSGAYSLTWAASMAASADDNIPGVVASTPATGTLTGGAGLDNNDVFAVELGAGDRISATLTADIGTDFDLYLYLPGATVLTDYSAIVGASYLTEYPESIAYTAKVPGTYYLDVQAYGGSGAYSLQWSVEHLAPEADDDIPGIPMLGSPVFGGLSVSADVDDVYQVYLDAGQEMTATLGGDSTGDFDLRLYGASAAHIAWPDLPLLSSTGGTSAESIAFTAPSAGRYYLDVRAAVGQGNYDLSVVKSLATVDGEIPGVVAPASPVSGLLGVDADYHDVYRLDVTAGQQITASLAASAPADFSLNLWGPSATSVNGTDSVAASYWHGDPEHITFIASETGTYYLDVTADSGYGTYVLDYSVGAATVSATDLQLAATQTPLGASLSLSATLTAGAVPVQGAELAFETLTPQGWSFIASAATDPNGVARIVTAPDVTPYRVRHSGDSATAASTSAEVTVADIKPPTIEVSGFEDGRSYATTVTPTVTITGETSSTVTLDGLAFASGTPVGAEGTHTLAVAAEDAVGNLATRTATFTIDRTPPNITVGGVESGRAYATTVTPTVTITGETSSTVTLDGVAFVSGTPVGSERTHTLAVAAEDAVGNLTERAVTFSIDRTAPDITVTGVLDSVSYRAAVTPVVAITGETSANVTLDGVVFTSGTPVTMEGAHTLRVSAEDAAGNLTLRTIGFTLDLTAPGIRITGVEEARTYENSATPVVVITGATSSAVTLDGAPYVSGTPVITGGLHTLRVSAQDAAGNASASSVTFAVLLSPTSHANVRITSPSAVLTVFGQSLEITGTLDCGAVRLANKPVELWTSDTTGFFVKSSHAATTGPDGTFSFAVAPQSATYYMVRFAGDADALASELSNFVRLIPAAAVGDPAAPASVYRTKRFTVQGSLAPAHTAGAQAVKVYTFLKVGASWVAKGSVTATVTSDGAGYSAVVALGTAGSWKLRALHPLDADHGETWAANDAYVTVRDVSVGTPVAYGTMRVGRTYAVYGGLSPKHPATSAPVRIYRYLKVGTRWVNNGYVRATVSDYRTYSRYSAKLRLNDIGKWRLRAYHPADALHPAKWSSYRQVTVE